MERGMDMEFIVGRTGICMKGIGWRESSMEGEN